MEKKELYKLNITIALMKNIYLKDLYFELNKLINFSMAKSQFLLDLHNKNGFKHYSFSNFTPIEKDYIYKKGNFYNLSLQSLDNKIIQEFKHCLDKLIFNEMVVYNTNIKTIKLNQLKDIVTITPFVVTKDNKCLDKKSIIFIKNALIKNSIRKFNDFYKQNIDEDFDFMENIEIINAQPIVANYKGGVLIGNKCRITIKDDELSQKIGQVILGSGLGEKNTIGMGYCKGFK